MAWDTRARLDKALMLYRGGFIDAVLCTGGIFQKGQVRPVSSLMAECLLEKGVPKGAVLTEEKSVDTAENIRFGLAVLKKKGLLDVRTTEDVRLVLISESLHLRRVEITARAYLKELGLGDLVPLIMEPVHYSVSEATFHYEEAAFHMTATDPLGKGEIFEATRRERRLAAKKR